MLTLDFGRRGMRTTSFLVVFKPPALSNKYYTWNGCCSPSERRMCKAASHKPRPENLSTLSESSDDGYQRSHRLLDREKPESPDRVRPCELRLKRDHCRHRAWICANRGDFLSPDCFNGPKVRRRRGRLRDKTAETPSKRRPAQPESAITVDPAILDDDYQVRGQQKVVERRIQVV